MKRNIFVVLSVVWLVCILISCSRVGESNAPSPTPTADATPTVSPSTSDPMRDGAAIPYIQFMPPHIGPNPSWDGTTTYIYDHDDILEIYQEQLKAAGFTDQGSFYDYSNSECESDHDGVMRVVIDSIWSYTYSESGTQLRVDIHNGNEHNPCRIKFSVYTPSY